MALRSDSHGGVEGILGVRDGDEGGAKPMGLMLFEKRKKMERRPDPTQPESSPTPPLAGRYYGMCCKNCLE
ncbi:Hypothetical protein FKW44_020908 [Caligus rogercresseyi]|uniref:Uncharacterized protein n=1 Tax=Caligus rogercresseyi TaxID=217165 RepID=A0A7T8JVR4_CALRO|nr:Hypothetical protein FKW44_020908 [Caligus rogercresseyi]